MISLDDAVIAKLESHGERFEILVDSTGAQRFKEGDDINILDILAAEVVFKSSSKGDRASDDSLTKVFGTTDIETIARNILKKGDIQLTQAQRIKMRDKKKSKIVDIIVRNSINPQTNTPHPRRRIEMAIDESRVNIDPFGSADSQVEEILSHLKVIIPIRFDTLVMAVKLSGQDYGRCYADLKDMGKITREEWQKDGNWIGIVEIPAGLKLDFFDRINKRTHGEGDAKILE